MILELLAIIALCIVLVLLLIVLFEMLRPVGISMQPPLEPQFRTRPYHPEEGTMLYVISHACLWSKHEGGADGWDACTNAVCECRCHPRNRDSAAYDWEIECPDLKGS